MVFTFYGGHDPEDYQHRVGNQKTELDLHPNSPGYRLILNYACFKLELNRVKQPLSGEVVEGSRLVNKEKEKWLFFLICNFLNAFHCVYTVRRFLV